MRDQEAERAIGLSVFADLPTPLLDAVLADHRDVSVEPGHRFMGRDHPPAHRTGLVVSGLLRMYLQSDEGRQVSFRYAGLGYFLGAAATVGGYRPPVAAGVEAVTAARVLYLHGEQLRALAWSEAAVARALLRQMVRYQNDLLRLLAGTAFGSIRQRTAMHLLNLAMTRPDGRLIAPITQHGLGDAVGTTRETVARALGELRRAGLIATVRGGILVRDVDGLAAEAHWEPPV
jgi:CRP/FNR family transcriptional regulator, cyclic AMP receptor protein